MKELFNINQFPAIYTDGDPRTQPHPFFSSNFSTTYFQPGLGRGLGRLKLIQCGGSRLRKTCKVQIGNAVMVMNTKRPQLLRHHPAGDGMESGCG